MILGVNVVNQVPHNRTAATVTIKPLGAWVIGHLSNIATEEWRNYFLTQN